MKIPLYLKFTLILIILIIILTWLSHFDIILIIIILLSSLIRAYTILMSNYSIHHLSNLVFYSIFISILQAIYSSFSSSRSIIIIFGNFKYIPQVILLILKFIIDVTLFLKHFMFDSFGIILKD